MHAQLLKLCPILATLWTVSRQAPLSMGFSRKECWSGLPCLSPGYLPNSGIELASLAPQADSLLTELPGKLQKTSPIFWPTEGSVDRECYLLNQEIKKNIVCHSSSTKVKPSDTAATPSVVPLGKFMMGKKTEHFLCFRCWPWDS